MTNFLADIPLEKITYKKAQKLFECGAEFCLCPSEFSNPGYQNGINCTFVDSRIRNKKWDNFAHLYGTIKARRCTPVTGKKLVCYAAPNVLKEIREQRAAA